MWDIWGSWKSFIIGILVGIPIKLTPISISFMYVKLSLYPIWIYVYGENGLKYCLQLLTEFLKLIIPKALQVPKCAYLK